MRSAARNDADCENLDRAEGLQTGGYVRHSVPVRLFDDRTEEAMTYIAGAQHVEATCVPFDWYRDLVVTGAIEHGLPAPYIEELSQVPVMSDQNVRRAAGARKLLCRGSRL